MENFLDDFPILLRTIKADGSCLSFSKEWFVKTAIQNGDPQLSWLDTIHDSDRKTVEKNVSEAAKTQRPFSVTYRLLQKDGSYQMYREDANASFSETGEYKGLAAVLTPVLETSTSEYRSLQILRDIVEKAPFPIGVYTGKEMKIMVANKSITDVWGKGPDVIGKNYADILPEISTKILSELDTVYTTGIDVHEENQYVPLETNGVLEPYYFNYKFTPLYDENGSIYGVMNTAAVVTDVNVAKKKLTESEAKFRSLIEEAPVATCLFIGRELKIEIANQQMISLWGKDNNVIGQTLEEALPEIKGQPFLEILDRIFVSGETFEAVETPVHLIIDGALKTIFCDFTYKPLRDESGKVYGIMDMAVDVTERVLSRQKIEENQRQLLNSFEQSPVGIAILRKEDLTFTMVNPFYSQLVGRLPHELLNKPLLEALPELAGQGFDKILENVIETGVPFIANEISVDLLRNGALEKIYVDLVYQPQYGENKQVFGVFVVATNVTQQVVSRRKVEASEAKLRSVIANAPAGIGIFVGRDLIVQMPNKTFIDIVGKGPDITGKPLREVMPELLTEGQPFLKILDDVYTTGKMFHSYGSQVKIVQNGLMTYNYYNITYSPLFDENNEVYAILDIAIDVTEAVHARQKAEDAEIALRGAVELAELATWELDVKSNTFNYSDRFKEWLGFDEDNKTQEDVYNPLPGEYRQLVPDAIFEAIKPGGTGRYVNEHPIINQTTGEQRIIHGQAQLFYDSDGNPEVLRGTAQDVTRERELQQQLEYEVKKRTEELQEANAGLADANSNLQRSNAELAQFAYIASHDLQEPVRKISIFATMLEDQLGEIGPQAKNYLTKINNAAARMGVLIRDVLAYSQLANENENFIAVDLNKIAESAISDFELVIEQKNAKITFQALPVVEAIPLQMSQFFGNLISNSLKYSRRDVAPVIDIHANILTADEAVEHGIFEAGDYYKISFTDNGIGFGPEYAQQIFNIFQRLHGKAEYAGTGIGLAICKKIVQNHNGGIYAVSNEGNGATFTILLPISQHRKTISVVSNK